MLLLQLSALLIIILPLICLRNTFPAAVTLSPALIVRAAQKGPLNAGMTSLSEPAIAVRPATAETPGLIMIVKVAGKPLMIQLMRWKLVPPLTRSKKEVIHQEINVYPGKQD